MDRTIPDGGGPVRRKVQLTGGSTYTVSIPKEWAEARDIASGSVVDLYPFDDRLVIARPDEPGSSLAASVDVDSVGIESLDRQIVAAYAAGADEIRVESDTGFDHEQRRVANETITGLVGTEIAHETPRVITARNLLDPAEISLDGTIEQIRRISLSMHEHAIDALVSTEPREEVDRRAAAVVARDDEVDRLFALVCRQFYRVLGDVREVEKLRTTRLEASTQFRIARQLERVADQAEDIATISSRQTDPPRPELADQFETVATDARCVLRTALDGETRAALLRLDDLLGRLDDFDRELYESQREDVYLYGRVLESVRRTAEYGGNVAEVITLADLTNGDN